MNPWHLSASDLLIWGVVLHLIADWPLQNDWMANHKMNRRVRKMQHGDGIMTPPRPYQPPDRWWDRHPAAYVHAGIHLVFLALVFGWAAIPLAIVHLIIDTRAPVVWWSKLVGQTQPKADLVDVGYTGGEYYKAELVHLYDVGTEVRFWTDQVFHITCVAIAALLISL